MDVGDIIRPTYEEYDGVEDLIVENSRNKDVLLVRIRSNDYCKKSNGDIFRISRININQNSTFVRKATKAEMVLYGANK